MVPNAECAKTVPEKIQETLWLKLLRTKIKSIFFVVFLMLADVSVLTHPVVLVVEVVSSGSVIVSDSTAALKLQIILLNFA